MKLLTVVVPCYNSAAYMRHAVDSLLEGGAELDVLLVDDGSTDETGAIADACAREHPDIVRVIHQKNAGHGAGLNQGIRTAQGVYFKVLDSDDRVDGPSLRRLLELLRNHAAEGTQDDLVVHDYTYDKADRRNVFSVSYHRVMPEGRLAGWADCRPFPAAKQFMIPSLVYRTELLRGHGFVLPEHTFYEDNVYIYKPLPWTEKVLYLHAPVYAYNIGRDDQSINEKNIIRRLDQLTNMITQMATSWRLEELERLPEVLRRYMLTNLQGQLYSLNALQYIAATPESQRMHRETWQAIRDFDPRLYSALHRGIIGLSFRLPAWVTVFTYRVGRKIVHF